MKSEPDGNGSTARGGGWGLFFMLLAVSLGISFLLTAVFHMPIFILGTILPLFWLGRKSRSF